jgi:hypothetical protein
MAAHHASIECSRRAMLHEQPLEAAQALRKSAANASRTFVELLSALDRKRGKGGQQVVRVEHLVPVEHVRVHQGGQAIVGNAQGSDTATGEQHSSTRTRCRGARIAVSQAVVVGGLISLHPLTLGRNHDILDAAHRRWLRVWGWLCGPPARLTDLVRSIAERDA